MKWCGYWPPLKSSIADGEELREWQSLDERRSVRMIHWSETL